MRLLDRYILVLFLKNYLISLCVLLGLYVVLDMVVNFDELAGQRDAVGSGLEGAWIALSTIADYYFFQCFLIFNLLSGIIPVVASAFTIFRLNRNNELTAVMAAGVPLIRLIAPIILAAVVLNFVLVPVNQELIIPEITHKLQRQRGKMSNDTPRSFQVRMLDSEGRIVLATRYTPPSNAGPARMQIVDIIEPDSAFRPQTLISADAATWDESSGAWMLENGRRVTGLDPRGRRSPPEPVATYQSNLTPREVALMRSGDLVDLLSTAEINQLLRQPMVYGTADLLRVKHSRIAQWLLNVIVVLLAIGAMLGREPGMMQKRAMTCFALVGACLATIFVCQHLAGQPPAGGRWADQWPAILSWLPIFIFGPLSVWFADRIKS